METVKVQLADRSYDIVVGPGALGDLARRIDALDLGTQAFVVTDEQVGRLYLDEVVDQLSGRKVAAFSIPVGESSKTLRQASQLYDELIRSKADRRSAAIALGGGVVGDLTGFVAATFARGIAFVQIPTSLLSMVDASVGGKVAVDHPRAKNMIGAFHQPRLVVCDLSCLASLSDREYLCGLAEVVKYGVILDADFFKYVEDHVDAVLQRDPHVTQHLVAHSCQIKADVVEQDEHETTGLRAALNYGHTFAHVFETASGYESIRHGEAVAMGMICAGRLAERLGMVDASFNQRQEHLWSRLGLPTKVPGRVLARDLTSLMRSDKKAQAGQVRFMLPTRMGEVIVVDGVDLELVSEVIVECADR